MGQPLRAKPRCCCEPSRGAGVRSGQGAPSPQQPATTGHWLGWVRSRATPAAPANSAAYVPPHAPQPPTPTLRCIKPCAQRVVRPKETPGQHDVAVTVGAGAKGQSRTGGGGGAGLGGASLPTRPPGGAAVPSKHQLPATSRSGPRGAPSSSTTEAALPCTVLGGTAAGSDGAAAATPAAREANKTTLSPSIGCCSGAHGVGAGEDGGRGATTAATHESRGGTSALAQEGWLGGRAGAAGRAVADKAC
jgi:hypothetical protein